MPVEYLGGGWNGGSWLVASDPVVGSPAHGLRAYAVGVQALDSRNQWQDLNGSINHYSAESPGGFQVSAYATVGAHELLVGGGFSVYSGENVHPVDAYAHGMFGGQWQVNARGFTDHAVKVISEAVGMGRCLPVNSPVICFGHRRIVQGTSSNSYLVNAAHADNTDTNYAPVGVGVISSSWSRAIWGMLPWMLPADATSAPFGGGIAYTTDPSHVSGNVTAQVMLVGL